MKILLSLKAIVICLLFSQSNILHAQSNGLSFVPHIQYGKATLSGKIDGVAPGNQGYKSMNLSFSSVITSGRKSYEIPVKKDGSFTLSIPVECISIGNITSDYYEGLICLIPGEETKLEIRFYHEQKKHIKLINSIGLTADDAMNIATFPWEVPGIGDEIITPEIFSQRVINRMPGILKTIEDNTKLSSPAKQIVITETKLMTILYKLFEYPQYINNVYLKQHKTDTVPKEFQPQIPGKSYYSFLKYFNLNDPAYLTATMFPMVLQSLLENKTLAIPAIAEMPVDKWLIKVKEILKDDIGSDTGIIYDLLSGNAFGKQLNDMNPLSDIQKKNIRSYFTNKSFEDILINENEKVLQLAAKSSMSGIFKIDKSSEKGLDSIITKYKGKVVFVDFWATWCVPCLKAMKESEIVRKEFENKDVIFVYITNYSSPRLAWEPKAIEIGGDHFYFDKEKWNYLNKIYNFTAIPHYLIFDKMGNLRYNHSSFMGIENMKKWINESL